MLGDNFALAAIGRPNLEMHPTIQNVGALRRASQMQRQLPDYFVPNKPSPRRTKSAADNIQAYLFGQVVKGRRSVGVESRTHSGTKPRLRMPDLLPPCARLTRGLAMEMQFRGATHKLHIGASLAQQSSQIQRRSSATDHHNAPPAEGLDLAMPSAVREKFRRKMCQVLGNILEVSDAYRQYNLAGLKNLAVFKPQQESAGRSIHGDY